MQLDTAKHKDEAKRDRYPQRREQTEVGFGVAGVEVQRAQDEAMCLPEA